MIGPSQRLIPDNTQHSQETEMSPVGFEPAIPQSEGSQIHALDRAASGVGKLYINMHECVRYPVISVAGTKNNYDQVQLRLRSLGRQLETGTSDYEAGV
jgi:hypothetical protein